MCEKCQILVPLPILQPSSRTAEACTKNSSLCFCLCPEGFWLDSKGISRERCASLRTLRTRSPSKPSVIGFVPLEIQSRKCRHSSFNGSSWGIIDSFRILLLLELVNCFANLSGGDRGAIFLPRGGCRQKPPFSYHQRPRVSVP